MYCTRSLALTLGLPIDNNVLGGLIDGGVGA
jgi:hypothetical protein